MKHIIVTGHYDCGGIRAAMEKQSYELIDGWLRNIKDIYINHRERFEQSMTEKQKLDYLTELSRSKMFAIQLVFKKHGKAA